MVIHANAALTVKQRQEIQRRHAQGESIRSLAQRFQVSVPTVQRWAQRESPLDRTTAPLHHATVVSPDFRAAVLAYRTGNPNHGPIRIAAALAAQFPQANRGNVQRILQQEGLTRRPTPPKTEPKHIPVGWHRVQMDIQQLPAIEGGKGFEYKFTVIHLRTRYKYSEIHDNHKSKTAAGVLQRALDHLPPFFSSGPTMPTSSP